MDDARRRDGPKRLGDGLSRGGARSVSGIIRQCAMLSMLEREWERIVPGPSSRASSPYRFNDGVLHIYADGHAAYDLNFRKAAIAGAIRSKLRIDVKEIVIDRKMETRPRPARTDPPRKRRAKPVPPPSAEDIAGCREEIASLYPEIEGELLDAMARCMAVSRR